MQINKIILALWILGAFNGEINTYFTSSKKPLIDISGMVKESNPDTLGLKLYYEQPTLENDWFGRYCHLYANDCLLVSAPAIKCFFYHDDLIVFLGDIDGYIEQIKVFKKFIKNYSLNMTVSVYKPRPMPASAYKPIGFLNPPIGKAKPFDYDLLSDIDMVKLDSSGTPIAMMKVNGGRAVIDLRTYDKLEYKDLN